MQSLSKSMIAAAGALMLLIVTTNVTQAQSGSMVSRKAGANALDACVGAVKGAYDPGRHMPAGDCKCTGEPGRLKCAVPLRESSDPDADRFFSIKSYTADTQEQACQKAREYASTNWQKPSGECICGDSFSRKTCYIHAVPKAYSGPPSRGAIPQ